jgi:outer membrane protein assembly factor BamD (BamD/ComL family)
MSVSGISSSAVFNSATQSIEAKVKQFQQEFQQLGQDLQSGNLSAAQSDFVTLQQIGSQNNSAASGQGTSSIAQAFSQLGQDLQSGNISGAQQDFANIQQAFQNQASPAQDTQTQDTQTQGHHHHHHGGGASDSNTISQLFEQLGTQLQSGNVSGAQQTYSSLLQDLQATGQSSQPALSQATSGSTSSGVSVSA